MIVESVHEYRKHTHSHGHEHESGRDNVRRQTKVRIPYYRNKSITIEGNPLLYKEIPEPYSRVPAQSVTPSNDSFQI